MAEFEFIEEEFPERFIKYENEMGQKFGLKRLKVFTTLSVEIDIENNKFRSLYNTEKIKLDENDKDYRRYLGILQKIYKDYCDLQNKIIEDRYPNNKEKIKPEGFWEDDKFDPMYEITLFRDRSRDPDTRVFSGSMTGAERGANFGAVENTTKARDDGRLGYDLQYLSFGRARRRLKRPREDDGNENQDDPYTKRGGKKYKKSKTRRKLKQKRRKSRGKTKNKRRNSRKN